MKATVPATPAKAKRPGRRAKKPDAAATAPAAWDAQVCAQLIDDLWALRQTMLDEVERLWPWLRAVDPAFTPSAINLAHYLALRRIDLRALQERLAWMGLSSLGRAETHVLANLDKVLGILHRLAGREWKALAHDEPVGSRRGPEMLGRHAQDLLGPPPGHRDVRIMVTLPSVAAVDDAVVEAMVQAGMDVARINCAHDTPPQWAAMAMRVRKAARRAARPVRILMDLGGPKLRTGPLATAHDVIKLRPHRDSLGTVLAPARLTLWPRGGSAAQEAPALAVDPAWFERLRQGDVIVLKDARGARRQLVVAERHVDRVLATTEQTAYITAETILKRRKGGGASAHTGVFELPVAQGTICLHRGDRLRLSVGGVGHEAILSATGRVVTPATVPCTLPAALASVRKGDRIWFDDGRIGGVIKRRLREAVEVEITQARNGGERLAADKGINLPDTALELPALTDQDLEDLEVVARHADIVGLSFCQGAGDVLQLRHRLDELGASHLGVMLKVETKRGFEHLPEMLLAAMQRPRAGVMIARGDLAVECGYERLAEVQEEILWACEAAHMPVVWATQVLESLSKTGLPSRAEITDAAMGERAECVMLNKGPHVVDAIRMLNDILGRMQAHQSKKRSLLRALRSWDRLLAPP